MQNLLTKLKTLAVFGIAMRLALSAQAENRSPDYTTADGNDWLYNHAIGTNAAYAAKKCPNEAAADTGVDLNAIGAFRNKQLKNVKITATISR